MKRTLLLQLTAVIVSMLVCMNSYAQGRRITGTVSDERGAALSGATITAKGGAALGTTDTTGKFSITLPSNVSAITITYVGMQPKDVSVTGGTDNYTVTLTSSSTSLSDVVVVGYGTARRRDVTGAVSTVKARELTQVGTSDPVQAMQGRV
jgi:hypothetical protein